MPYVEVYVDDADITDFETDELLAELEKRGKAAEQTETGETLNAIYYAFYFGKPDEAVDLMRTYVQDVTGRVLP